MSDPDRYGARDLWLSEALRHAPDSNATAPAALSEAILAEARAVAARPGSSSPRRARVDGRTLADVFGSWWIALARPPVAAAFASVMAATIVGLMWWGRPMDETLPRPASPVARTAPVTQPPAPAQAEVPSTPPVPAPPHAEPTPPASARGALSGATTTDRIAAPPAARKKESPAAFPATAARRAVARERGEEAKKDAAPSSFAGPAATAAPAETATAPAAPSDAGRAAGQVPSEIAADRADKPMAKNTAPAREPRPAGTAALRQRSALDPRENADALERDKAAVAPSPLASLLDSISREPQRWTRQTVTGGAAAVDPAWRGWLADVDAAVAGRWQTAGASASSAQDEGRDAAPLRLFLDGRAAAIVRLDGRTIRLERLLGAAPEHWQASLAPAPASRVAAGRARLSP